MRASLTIESVLCSMLSNKSERGGVKLDTNPNENDKQMETADGFNNVSTFSFNHIAILHCVSFLQNLVT